MILPYWKLGMVLRHLPETNGSAGSRSSRPPRRGKNILKDCAKICAKENAGPAAGRVVHTADPAQRSGLNKRSASPRARIRIVKDQPTRMLFVASFKQQGEKMKRCFMFLIVAGSLLFSNTIFAATQDELTLMIYDARGAIGLGKYEDAMGLCDQALKSNPDSAEAYAVRSQAKFGLQDIDGALQDADKAIGLQPEEYIDPAYYVRARIALEQAADPAEALGFIEKAIDIVEFEPVPEYFELRADIYKSMGKQDLADADLLKAKEIRSK